MEIHEEDSVTPEPSQSAAQPISASALRLHNDAFLDALERAADVADRRTSDLLFAFSAVLIAAAFAFKLRPLGLQVSDLSSGEFTAVLAAAIGLIAAATVVRILASRTVDAAMQHQTEVTQELVRADTRITEAAAARHGARTDAQLAAQRQAEADHRSDSARRRDLAG